MSSQDIDDDSGLPLQLPQRALETNPSRGVGRAILRRGIWVPFILLVLFTGGVLGLYFQPPGIQRFFARFGLEPGGGTDAPIAVPADPGHRKGTRAVSSDERDVVGLGVLVPRGEVATLAPPYGAADARVAALEVAVGDRVERDQVLAVLDNLPQLQSAVASAEAAVNVREASLAQMRHAVGMSKKESRASLARARDAASTARSELERVRSLFDRGAASRSELEIAESALAQATQDVKRTRATLSRYESSGSGPGAQADVLVALRNLESARADLERAQRDLARGYVRAPAAGTVLDIHVRPGEKPGQQGVMSLANLDEMTAEVEVFQTLVARVSPGDPVEMVADALPERLHGQVERVGLEVGRQSLIEDGPAANTDARVVKVVVQLDRPSSAAARSYTNLQVVARIRPGRGRSP